MMYVMCGCGSKGSDELKGLMVQLSSKLRAEKAAAAEVEENAKK